MAGRESWNMARIASRRPLPRPHLFAAPVGEKLKGPAACMDRACCFCGYLECGCRRDMYASPPRSTPLRDKSAFARAVDEHIKRQRSAWDLHQAWAEGKTNIPLSLP